jgi:hypothetical protein
MCDKELLLTQEAIQHHPKSYWIWNHREWILQHMPTADWKRELKLVSFMLDKDTRNFHGWDYRRHIVQQIRGLDSGEEYQMMWTQNEFAYCESKIAQSFSNCSAWHYRNNLLGLILEGEENKMGVLEREFELVKQAIYTDPLDQSAWLYYQWLIETHARAVYGNGFPELVQHQIKVVEELMAILDRGEFKCMHVVQVMMCRASVDARVSKRTNLRRSRVAQGHCHSPRRDRHGPQWSVCRHVRKRIHTRLIFFMSSITPYSAPYEGVKLAPSISKVRLIGLERRLDANNTIYYTIHITPAPISFHSAALPARLSFKRKPYTIYRRHEDFGEFGRRLQTMLLGRRPQVLIDLPHLIATDTYLDEVGEEITSEYTESGKTHRGIDELDLFLKRVLTLPTPLLQEKVVAEFFGIWKSDIEYKMQLNQADPFALSVKGRTILDDPPPDEPSKATGKAAALESLQKSSAKLKAQKRSTLVAGFRPALRRAKTAFLRAGGLKVLPIEASSSDSGSDIETEDPLRPMTNGRAMARQDTNEEQQSRRDTYKSFHGTEIVIGGNSNEHVQRRTSSSSELSGLGVVTPMFVGNVQDLPPWNRNAVDMQHQVLSKLRRQKTLPVLNHGVHDKRYDTKEELRVSVGKGVDVIMGTRHKRANSDVSVILVRGLQELEDNEREAAHVPEPPPTLVRSRSKYGKREPSHEHLGIMQPVASVSTSALPSPTPADKHLIRQTSLARIKLGLEQRHYAKSSTDLPSSYQDDDELTVVRSNPSSPPRPPRRRLLSNSNLSNTVEQEATDEAMPLHGFAALARLQRAKSSPNVRNSLILQKTDSISPRPSIADLARARTLSTRRAKPNPLVEPAMPKPPPLSFSPPSSSRPLKHKKNMAIREEYADVERNYVDLKVVLGKRSLIKIQVGRTIPFDELSMQVFAKFKRCGYSDGDLTGKMLVYRDQEGNVVRIESDFELSVVLLGCPHNMTFFYV